jgi:2-polyprenyl-6-methoxyphenol hydroxylase-like FAD-dependent oxidoreductase
VNLQGLRVVVVGGAIGGASAALVLARAGAQVTLLERESAARPVGAGIALAENGLAVLHALGIDVVPESSELSGARVVDARGRTLFAPSGEGSRVRMIRRSALYTLLGEAVARAGIDARFGEELSSLDGGRVITRSGTLEVDLVIGADGVHSRVRATAGFDARVRKLGASYVRALAPRGLARNEEAWTSAGLFGSFDLPDGTYWYASCGTVKRALEQRDLASLRAAWTRAYPASEPLLAALPSFDALLIHDVLEVECSRYVRGNVALVGDAAHAMAPNLGQGANSALVDAAVLGDELRRADTLQGALQAYDARRRPRVQAVARTAARLGALAELTNPVLRSLRDRVVMPLSARRGDGARLALQEDPRALAQLAICSSAR